jgi:CIC family chloride channel protein
MDLTRLRLRAGELVEDLREQEDRLALVLSLVIGAVVGLVVVAFILVTGRIASHLYPPGGSGVGRILVPVIGSLVSGFLLVKYFPNARGSGIPQTRAALFIHDGMMSLRTVAGKFICCSISLASGISLGREGPSVQIGAGVASVIAQRVGLSREQIKWLVPVGGAAALAAAFNTPIAAVLFSLEEITGDLHTPIIGSVVLSSATAWIVLHLFLGDNPLFHVTPYHLVNPAELLIYALLGVVGGFVSVMFVRLLLRLREKFADLPGSTLWVQPVVGGLTVGIMGYFVPEVLGVGYDVVERVLGGNVVLRVVLLLAILKLIATAVCYASGNAGGIFGPSLFLGAMVGAVVGSAAHALMPDITAGPGAYALVGMGAAFAGIIRTPMTSVIMIFEVTRDYSIIVPLMIANLLSFYISHRMQKESIYEALARQDGLHLPRHASETRATIGPVTLAIREAPSPLNSRMTVTDAALRIEDSQLTSWPVCDSDGLTGMIRATDIRDAATAHPAWTLSDLMFNRSVDEDHLAHVHTDHPLSLALSRMGSSGHDVLPVVSRANGRILLGIVTLKDVLRAFGVEKSKRTSEFRAPPFTSGSS